MIKETAYEVHRSLIKNERCKAYKTCPNCGSFFLNDSQCESCGRQISYNPLGETLGPRSFFSIKEEHHNSLGYFSRKSTFLEFLARKKIRSYNRKLLYRYKTLIHHLFTSENHSPDFSANIFKLELTNIIHQLLKNRISKSQLEKILEEEEIRFSSKNDKKLLTTFVLNSIESSQSQIENSPKIPQQIREYQLLGTFNLFKWLTSFLIMSSIVFLFYILMKIQI